MSTLDQHTNFAYSTVAVAPSPATSGTSLDVATGNGALFPTVPFNATVWPAGVNPLSTNAEIVRVTNIAGDTLTITRAQESSAARTIVIGDQIAATITKKTFTDIEGYFLPKVSYTQNYPIQIAGENLVSKGVATINGTRGVGSSLFLQRMMIPANMNITEMQMAFQILPSNTASGQGSLSRSFCIYSFGNSTSLASVSSISGSSSWITGTSTAGTSVSLTQFQGGWSRTVIQPLTFAAMVITPGEYVIGHLMDIDQAVQANGWTLIIKGAAGVVATPVLNGINVTSANVLSSGGLIAGSLFSSSASGVAIAGNGGLIGISANSATTGSNLTVWTAGQSALNLSGVASTAALTTTTVGITGNIKATATAASVVSLLMNTGIGGFGALSSGGLLAGSFFTSSALASFMSTGGLLAGSLFSSSASVAIISSLAGANINAGGMTVSGQNYIYVGTGSTTTNFPSVFYAGIMSTGGLPSAITLTSAAVTYWGSAMNQPWMALIGT